MSRSDKNKVGRNIAKTRAGVSNAVNGGSGVYSTKSGGYKSGGDRFEPSKKGTGVRDHVRNKKSKCFITTAACEFRGLSDDCPELETLRAFRDAYLMRTAYGRDLVGHYYTIAPRIANALTESDSEQIVWPAIEQCLQAIASGMESNAVGIYSCMVQTLEAKYQAAMALSDA
jgi:hypothetical protein